MDGCALQNSDGDFPFLFLMLHALGCEGPTQNWDPQVQIHVRSLSEQNTGH